MKLRDQVSHARLKEVLSYNKRTGVFKWKLRLSNRTCVGSVAGCVSKTHYNISIDGVKYAAHRLAWFYVYGTWPGPIIDHKDGNGFNNAIRNLRDVDATVNVQNLRSASSRNKLGVLGVYRCSHKDDLRTRKS